MEENYGYRINNLVVDDVVYEKLVKLANYWRSFIRLWERVDAAHRARLGEALSARSPASRQRDEQRFLEELAG